MKLDPASWLYPIIICMLLSRFRCVWLFVTLGTIACQAPLPLGFSRQEYGVGHHALLQGIFLTQGSNICLLCLLHWQVGSLHLARTKKPILSYNYLLLKKRWEQRSSSSLFQKLENCGAINLLWILSKADLSEICQTELLQRLVLS